MTTMTPNPAASCTTPAPALPPVHCDYCTRPAIRVNGAVLYPRRYDLYGHTFWYCPPCQAWVGCHPDGRPLGRLANAALRQARMEAHRLFDPLWQQFRYAYPNLGQGHFRKYVRLRRLARDRAYAWLAAQLSIPVEQCHMAMFNLDQCRRVVAIIQEQRPTPASIRAWVKNQEPGERYAPREVSDRAADAAAGSRKAPDAMIRSVQTRLQSQSVSIEMPNDKGLVVAILEEHDGC